MNRKISKTYLERFQPLVAVGYNLKAVKKFFSENPEKFYEKRAIELLCGAILSAWAKNTIRETFEIIFLLRPESREKYRIKPTLNQIVLDNLVADIDVDCILISKKRAFFIQITRLVKSKSGGDSIKCLYQLIRKKCNLQTDKNMVLVILCDATFKLDVNKVHDFVDAIEHFPYARLYLIAQLGEKPKVGRYDCISIFPEMQEPQTVELYLY